MKALAKLGVRDDKPELVLAQYRAFSRQLPLMYIILLINTASLAATFRASAPAFLTIICPAVLSLVCFVRLVRWWFVHGEAVTVKKAVDCLRLLVALSFLLGTAYTVWGLALFDHGDAVQKLHVVYFITVSVFASTICLTHLRVAAVGLLCTTIMTMSVRLLMEPYGVATAMAFDGLFVAMMLIVVVSRSYVDFAALIESKQVLARRTAEAVQLFEENRELAARDALTSLPNRRWFFAELGTAVEAARGGGHPHPVVAVIDLDGFKPVNDLHGHSAGDRILVEVGRRLARHAGDHVRVARLGGDEFAIILTDLTDLDAARRLGERICIDLGQPYDMVEFVAHVNASLGFSEIGVAQCSGGQLYEQADYALNYAKRSARGQVTFFSPDHAREIRDSGQIDHALRSAELNRELHLNYQPIIDGRSGRIIAFEALGRWRSPVLGPIPPGIFIGAAERSGRIGYITVELLSQMLRDMSAWPEHIRLSFNLSVHDLCSPDIMARIAALIASSGHRADRIDFEITEAAIMHDFEHTTRTLRSLKALGCGIALDDFGTGYSSLNYVHQVPLDRIKVDRSFLLDLGRDPVRFALTRSIIGLCDNLGLDCVIEGVENDAQHDLIRRLGAPQMQGYLFGKPKSLRGALAVLMAEGTGEVREMKDKRPSAA